MAGDVLHAGAVAKFLEHHSQSLFNAWRALFRGDSKNSHIGLKRVTCNGIRNFLQQIIELAETNASFDSYMPIPSRQIRIGESAIKNHRNRRKQPPESFYFFHPFSAFEVRVHHDAGNMLALQYIKGLIKRISEQHIIGDSIKFFHLFLKKSVLVKDKYNGFCHSLPNRYALLLYMSASLIIQIPAATSLRIR